MSTPEVRNRNSAKSSGAASGLDASTSGEVRSIAIRRCAYLHSSNADQISDEYDGVKAEDKVILVVDEDLMNFRDVFIGNSAAIAYHECSALGQLVVEIHHDRIAMFQV